MRVHAWFESNAPEEGQPRRLLQRPHRERIHGGGLPRRASGTRSMSRCSWQRAALRRRLAGRSWPVEYGGQGRGVAGRRRGRGAGRYGVSTKMFAVALEMCRAVLFRARHRGAARRTSRASLRGDEVWCQLLSEPDAGSDLANVRTLATPVDGRLDGHAARRSGRRVRAPADFALLHRPHRSRVVSGAPGLSLLRRRHAEPGVDGAAAAPDVGRLPLQRGVPRRRASSPDDGPHRRPRRRLDACSARC